MARTNAGRDWQSRIMGDTASSGVGVYAPCNWIGITADATVPSVASTVLTGELTGGSMGRAQSTYAHTNGQASFTMTKQFTADRTVVLAKMGFFTAVTGGTLAFETMMDSTASLQSGDTIQLVATISL